MTTNSDRFDRDLIVRFIDVATEAMAQAREEVDALNVYPVPDGDTGTNMFLTLSQARDAVNELLVAAPESSLDDVMARFGRGALLGARGNSGVILAQILGAIARTLAEATADEKFAQIMARALTAATDASYAAVGKPVEGTILTVARAASDAAARAAGEGARTAATFVAAAAAARQALSRTPEMLQVLADAGVVDAGGRGLCVLLDAAEHTLTGKRPLPMPSHQLGEHRIPHPADTADLTAGGPAYEVMYLLEADEAHIAPMKAKLGPLGDSLVVVGGDGLWNVHVHVDDVGAAIEAGIEAGRPYRVRVTHFAEQVSAAQRVRPLSGRAVVAVAAGPGLARLFGDSGATVLQAGVGHRPSTGEILDAVHACGAAEVIVLPNDADSMKVAEIAARTAEEDDQRRVVVIPTPSQVQGLAAMAVHEPGRAFEQDVLEMTATARHVRHGAVTVAVKEAMTSAGPCGPGDVLGAIDFDFVELGDDLAEVGCVLVRRLLDSGGELVTLVAGADDITDGQVTDRVEAYIAEHWPHVDVVTYDGGQQRYPLLLSVE